MGHGEIKQFNHKHSYTKCHSSKIVQLKKAYQTRFKK